jgi:hypothetical protein
MMILYEWMALRLSMLLFFPFLIFSSPNVCVNHVNVLLMNWPPAGRKAQSEEGQLLIVNVFLRFC